jgi:hypothetical protein
LVNIEVGELAGAEQHRIEIGILQLRQIGERLLAQPACG